jgi:hypothetical protein
VLEDLDGGKVGTVVYPSQDPVEKILQSFQVNLALNPDLSQLLQQLRGAKVHVAVRAESCQGIILGIEMRPKALSNEGEPVEVSVLNLLEGGKIRSLFLDEITSLDFEDTELQAELAKALETLAQSRDQDKKPLTLHFNGEGSRKIRLGYLIETPIWKTSYRLVLPEKEKDKAYLQGWAIVENQTDNDWNDVDLSLVSGRPISFVQDLYQPLYITRPVVQPELYASLTPQQYGGGFGMAGGAGLGGGVAGVARRKAGVMVGREVSSWSLPDSEAPTEGALAEAKDLALAPAPPPAAPARQDSYSYAQPPINPAASVASAASAGKLGELFQYTVGQVTLPRQRSAMLPIVTDPIEIQRLSIYNESTLATNPLLGGRLVNTTGKHLLQGPLTVFDAGAYGGDSRIEDLPPDQNRLISFAIDLEVRVLPSPPKEETTLLAGKVVKGVLEVSNKRLASRGYVLVNRADKAKKILVEHPVRSGWDLTGSAKPVEKTEQVYRFEADVPPDTTSTLTVQEEMLVSQSIAILPMEMNALDFYAIQGAIPKAVREALVKAASLKRDLAETQGGVNQRQGHIEEISADQQRIRANLETAASQQTQYSTRLLKKLDEQETTIEKLQQEISDLEIKMEQQRKALEDYLANLTAE